MEGSSLGGVCKFLSKFRKFLVGGGAEAGVYCAFNLFAIFLGLLYVRPLKEMLWLGGGLDVDCNCLMVDHSFFEPGSHVPR